MPTAQADFPRTYPPFNALSYSLDVFVPFVSFGYEDHWRPNAAWEPIADVPVPKIAEMARKRSARRSSGPSHGPRWR